MGSEFNYSFVVTIEESERPENWKQVLQIPQRHS